MESLLDIEFIARNNMILGEFIEVQVAFSDTKIIFGQF